MGQGSRLRRELPALPAAEDPATAPEVPRRGFEAEQADAALAATVRSLNDMDAVREVTSVMRVEAGPE